MPFVKTIKDYERQVYAGVLGKVVGVYMGRPFEGWTKAAIEAKWGAVDRYVHEDVGAPLVVADDDISGTLTFVRALEDSGLYAETPVEFFGETWLNYLIEGRTVLWWGGMGHSTEHTAFLRLKQGVKAPLSGAIATNGRIVAEQIGAQIFIDGFGLVAPGAPELAAQLARRAASVSHDGEAVNAAVLVAGTIAAAFVEKDMGRLLDIGVGLIPEKSLIARIHRDVRGWARRDGDWRRTYDRIERKYGYQKYGGNCHVAPNHALMVLAWCYAPDDFHRAQIIVNTAGWDTDCNAANVGCLMGVKVGLERINEQYDFQTPFADRIVAPTAEGTRGVTDVLTEALRLAGIGRRVMGWRAVAPTKQGAWHHFSLPGALHGYMSEEDRFACRGAAAVANVKRGGGRAMQIIYGVRPGRIARVSTPLLSAPGSAGHYQVQGTPRLYPGMTVTARGVVGKGKGATGVRARLYLRPCESGDAAPDLHYGPAVRLAAGKPFTLRVKAPDFDGWPVQDVGLEITSERRMAGGVFIDAVALSGKPKIAFPTPLRRVEGALPGWIQDADVVRGPFSDDVEAVTRVGKNKGRGVLVTGTTDWRDYSFAARLSVHLAERAGILARYQGLQRYLALIKTADKLQLVLRYYEDVVLDEINCRWKVDELHALRLTCKGKRVAAGCDGKQLFEARDDRLGRGGAGFLFENGLIGFRDVKVSPGK